MYIPPNVKANPHNEFPRFSGMFRLAGTKSFRLASGKIFDEFGSNCQNPPKAQLATLEARPGNVLVQADQSGAEALIVAMLAPPGRYRELFAAGIKPHSFLALHIFGRSKPHWFAGLETSAQTFLQEQSPVALAKLPGWKTLAKRIADSDSEPDRPYYTGKRTAHARSYKMGWHTFQQAVLKDTGGLLILKRKDAEYFLSMFDTLFPEIAQWQEEVIATSKVSHVLHNLFGFPRQCEGLFNAGYERELISWIPQSTVGCITHEGVRAFTRHVRDTNKPWHLLNNKHDSYLTEVPAADGMEAATFMQSSLAVTLKGRDGIEFTMKSEVQIGRNWANKSDKNPEGMERVL